jgi:hypothetical protein
MPITILPYPNTVNALPGTPGVDWSYLYAPGLKIGGDVSGWRSAITFNCRYGILGAFCSAIAGKAVVIPTTYGGMLRILPLQHPIFTGLFATSLEAESYGTPSNTSTALEDLYSDARVTVTFENPKYDTNGDQAYMSLDIDQGSQVTTIPGKKLRFPNGEPIDQDMPTFSVRNSYALTLYNCASLNNALIDQLSGCVNQYKFMGWPEGQILFGGCKSSLQVSMGGVTQYQKTFSFTYQSFPWVQAIRRDGVLDTPLDPLGNPVYPIADLNLLLSN